MEDFSTLLLGDDGSALSDEINAGLQRSVGRTYPWPGNVRELEQAVRRMLLSRSYQGDTTVVGGGDLLEQLQEGIASGSLDARELQAGYCGLLYRQLGSYEEVARRTGLDRRTVKKSVIAKNQ